jgi:hypothetical protein
MVYLPGSIPHHHGPANCGPTAIPGITKNLDNTTKCRHILSSHNYLTTRLLPLLTSQSILTSAIDFHPIDYIQYTHGWANTPPALSVTPHIHNRPTFDLGDYNPSDIMAIHQLHLSRPTTSPTTNPTGYISTLHNATYLNAMTDSISMLIIEPGASMCISPHKNDFITYHSSAVKIKDLSSSTAVAGEGLLS